MLISEIVHCNNNKKRFLSGYCKWLFFLLFFFFEFFVKYYFFFWYFICFTHGILSKLSSIIRIKVKMFYYVFSSGLSSGLGSITFSFFFLNLCHKSFNCILYYVVSMIKALGNNGLWLPKNFLRLFYSILMETEILAAWSGDGGAVLWFGARNQ